VWLDDFVLWPSDLADTLKREFIVALGIQGAEQFEHMHNRACDDCGNAGDLGKNTVFIGNLLASLKDTGATSKSLDKLCERIIAFGA